MNEVPWERVILLVASGLGAAWALVKYAFPKLIESRIKRTEDKAETEIAQIRSQIRQTEAKAEAEIAREATANRQKEELLKLTVDQNALLTQFLTDHILAVLEKMTEKIDNLSHRLIAVETKVGMMVYEIIAQASDERSQENLHQLAGSNEPQSEDSDIYHSGIS